MARIITDHNSMFPRCSGCGEEFYYIMYGLDSRVRGPKYSKDAASRGSSAQDIAEFAAKHADCIEPVVIEEITESGILFRDRRRFRL